ncbi:MAG: hypothetical protein WBA12_01780 [Catalinimonas sp.]
MITLDFRYYEETFHRAPPRMVKVLTLLRGEFGQFQEQLFRAFEADDQDAFRRVVHRLGAQFEALGLHETQALLLRMRELLLTAAPDAEKEWAAAQMREHFKQIAHAVDRRIDEVEATR